MKDFKFLGYGSLRLHGRYWEAPQLKASLLIIHGFGEHGGRYARMAEYFVGHGISVMTYDKRGHGLSQGKRGVILRWEEHRLDAEKAVAELARRQPSVPMFILGHSFGGTVALDYTLFTDTPPRGIIASAPALGPPGISPILLALSRTLSAIVPKLTMDVGLDTDAVSRDPQECQMYRDDPLIHSRAAVRLGTELTAAQEGIFAHIAHLMVPLLCTYGSEDRLAPREPIERLFDLAGGDDKDLQIFEGAFHELHNDIIREDIHRLYAHWILQRV